MFGTVSVTFIFVSVDVLVNELNSMFFDFNTQDAMYFLFHHDCVFLCTFMLSLKYWCCSLHLVFSVIILFYHLCTGVTYFISIGVIYVFSRVLVYIIQCL